MTTIRRAAIAVLFAGMSCSPVLAATCNLTVLGSSVLDDAACTVGTGRSLTRIAVGTGGTILIRRRTLRVALPGDDLSGRRRRRPATVSYGEVVTSGEADDKICYFNQRAVLCIEP